MLKVLTAFLLAATAYLERWHAWKHIDLEKELQSLDDEIYNLSFDPSPDNLLRIEYIREKKIKPIRALQSSFCHTDEGH